MNSDKRSLVLAKLALSASIAEPLRITFLLLCLWYPRQANLISCSRKVDLHLNDRRMIIEDQIKRKVPTLMIGPSLAHTRPRFGVLPMDRDIVTETFTGLDGNRARLALFEGSL